MPSAFLLSFLGSSFFAFSVVFSQMLRRDLSVRSSALSKYALGRYGQVLTIGFYAIGLSEILLSIGLGESVGFGLGNMLLALAGIGALVVGLFKVELQNKSLKGYLHDMGAGVQFLSFPFALLQLRVILFHTPLYIFTNIVALGNVLLLLPIAYLYFSGTTHQQKYFGIIQKSSVLLMDLWVIVISFLLI